VIRANSQKLFVGILKDIQITHEGACYNVSLTGISSTEKLDHKKKNRSFQDISKTYREVMEQVIADTQGAKLWFQGANQTIQSPLYQIEETDWSFRFFGGYELQGYSPADAAADVAEYKENCDLN